MLKEEKGAYKHCDGKEHTTNENKKELDNSIFLAKGASICLLYVRVYKSVYVFQEVCLCICGLVRECLLFTRIRGV